MRVLQDRRGTHWTCSTRLPARKKELVNLSWKPYPASCFPLMFLNAFTHLLFMLPVDEVESFRSLKNKYEMNSECQISDGNTWVHRLAHPQQFLPDLYSLRTVPSVGKVRIANYAFCEQHHHQWAKEFVLELPLSLRGLKHQFTKESRTLKQVLNHIKRCHKAMVGFVRISNIKHINLVPLPW